MTLAHIALDNLSVSPLNMRHAKKAPDTTDLLPSIRTRGILMPLLVRPNGSPDTFEIVAGRRRYFAARTVKEERGDFPIPSTREGHTWQLVKGVALSTLLGVGTEIGFGDDEGDFIRALRESTQSNVNRAGQRIVGRNLDIQPTITVRQGWPLRVIVHKDLILRPYRGRR